MKSRAMLVGNSDGIGLAATKRLLAAGWDITGVSRSESPLSGAFKADIPEFEEVTRFINWGYPLITTHDNRKFEIERVYAVDNAFLQIFTFPMIHRDIKTALKEPNSIVLTETEARRVFGFEEALGQVIRVDNGDDFKVTGVIADVPKNSHLRFDGLISVSTMDENVFTRWFDNWVPLYVMLNPEKSFEETNEKIRFFLKKIPGGKKPERALPPASC